MAASDQTSEPTLAEALSRLNQLARPGSLLFVISDFHDLDGLAVTELRRLALQNLSVWVGPTLDDIDDPQDLTLLPPDWEISGVFGH